MVAIISYLRVYVNTKKNTVPQHYTHQKSNIYFNASNGSSFCKTLCEIRECRGNPINCFYRDATYDVTC